MNSLYLALIVLLVLALIGQIRIGAQVEYGEEGLFVQVRAGTIRIPVFPAKKKKSGEKKPRKKPDPSKDAVSQKKKGGKLELALKFIPLLLDTAKGFCRRLRVDKLDMELTVCAPDPADAAVRYGQANALLGSLWQHMTQVFHVKDGRAHVEVDFNAGASAIYILASLSLTIAQTLSLAVVFGWKALGIFLQNRSGRDARTDQGEAV